MVRLYQMLASDGRSRTPYLVRPPRARTYSLDLTPDQLAGLRQAMIAVVEQGTARGSRLRSLTIAGKTGTAQNPHGADHGWFIAFAPADRPEIVVGAIVEFAQHGSGIAPFVTRIIAHYLGVEATAGFRSLLPADTAPEPFLLPTLPRLDSVPRDTLRIP